MSDGINGGGECDCHECRRDADAHRYQREHEQTQRLLQTSLTAQAEQLAGIGGAPIQIARRVARAYLDLADRLEPDARRAHLKRMSTDDGSRWGAKRDRG